MKIQELINYGIKILEDNRIEDSYVKAKILLSYILNVEKNYLLIYTEKEVEEDKKSKYLEYLNEIINGKPLQYITNNQEFMGIDFYVDENVLIPQPDTEIIVEEVLKYIDDISNERKESNKENNNTIDILDLCTGSGAIAISIAKHANTNITVYASDISEKVLQIVKQNAKKNEVKIECILSNMFENILNNKFDIIVSNPPYIKSEVIKGLPKEVQNEPHIALDGGEDGLNFYKIISEKANEYLKANGSIFLEIGYDQKDKIIELFEKTQVYGEIKSKKDLAGNDRVIIIKNKI